MTQLCSIVMCIVCALAAPAFGADAARYHGPEHCRIAQLEPAPAADPVRWSGQCKAGFAEGPGVLEWRAAHQGPLRLEATLVRGAVSGQGKLTYDKGRYTGTMRHGLPHGQGYFEYAGDLGWYEGEVRDGKRQGYGTHLGIDRSSYEGQWQDDYRHGAGRASFALGGSYEGEWQNGKFDGQGTIVYAGSGHKYQGLFADGRVLGVPPAEVDTGSYSLKSAEPPTGSHIPRQRVTGDLPVNARWSQLTGAQQNGVKAPYYALEAGDQPPFPAHGLRPLFDAVATIGEGFPGVSGTLRLYVQVGADGTATTVAAIGSPDPELTRLVSAVAVLQRYKSALCRGKPCAMIFPLAFTFGSAALR